jgi:hypothetical protein
LVFLHLIVDETPGEARDRADAGAEPGIARNGADDCAASRADRGTGQRPLLACGHIRAAGQGQRRHYPGQNEPFDRALRVTVAFCGQG